MSLFRFRSDNELKHAEFHGDFIMVWADALKHLFCLVLMIIAFLSMFCLIGMLI